MTPTKCDLIKSWKAREAVNTLSFATSSIARSLLTCGEGSCYIKEPKLRWPYPVQNNKEG